MERVLVIVALLFCCAVHMFDFFSRNLLMRRTFFVLCGVYWLMKRCLSFEQHVRLLRSGLWLSARLGCVFKVGVARCVRGVCGGCKGVGVVWCVSL